MITELAQRWGVDLGEELAAGYCSRVYAVGDHVLRVPFQGEELDSGFRAALVLQEFGGPKIIRSDEATGALLMERIRPGVSLGDSAVSEEVAFEVICSWLERWQSLPTTGMKSVGSYWTSPSPLLQKLLETSPEPRFLHGDLHHFNLLWSDHRNEWVPIDPKGLIGDPNFEAIAFLRNPIGKLPSGDELLNLLRNRVLSFRSRLGLNPCRILEWAQVDFQSDIPEPGSDWERVAWAVGNLLQEMA